MAVCPICERAFDEHEYQLVIRNVGAFDSFACAEEGLRRHVRRTRGELALDLLAALTPDGAGESDEPDRPPDRQAGRITP